MSRRESGSGNGWDSRTRQLFEEHYDRIRALAQRQMKAQPADHTWSATGLVHEYFVRLSERERTNHWVDKHHFMAVSARALRQILTSHGRKRRSAKRGGGRPRIPFDEQAAVAGAKEPSLEQLDDAMSDLGRDYPDLESLVEMRFFGGMTYQEIGDVMSCDPGTVKSDIQFGLAWIKQYLSDGE